MGVTEQTAQDWEKSWWESCNFNTFGEEAKQLTYANLMLLSNEPAEGKWPVYHLDGSSVIDIGGGPVSLLLKCIGRGDSLVVDPCPYPEWVSSRYEAAGIRQATQTAESFRSEEQFDEAWIYNCLLHVEDPEAVILTASLHAKRLRIFEWLETEINVGHPHTLTAGDLNDWIGATGEVGYVNENGAVGLAYWGRFAL